MHNLTQRLLLVYSGVLTAAFAFVLLSGAAAPGSKSPARARFDEIDVQRINVREADGTLRMVLSNHARLPGIVVRGKERPFERPQAGMIFYNDEASEIGGLIFGGRKDAQGDVRDSGGSLSFDRYEGNQIVQLLGVDDKEDRIAGLMVSDSLEGGAGQRRILVGKGDDGVPKVVLSDANGKKRLILQVAADGTPSLTFLDATGKVVQQIAGKSEAP